MLLLALLQQTVFGSNPWELNLYSLNAPGVGSGRCELGFHHSIFDRDECEFAIKDLGYEVDTISTVSHRFKVCGCSYNPNTKHMQYNAFIHEDYCYVSPKNGNGKCMHNQDVNSSGSGLIALCYVKGNGASPTCMAEAAAKPEEAAATRADYEKGCEFASVVQSKSQCLTSCAEVTAAPTDCCECNGTCGQCDCAYCKYFCEKYFEDYSAEEAEQVRAQRKHACTDWGNSSKKDNGCRAFYDGWLLNPNGNSCHGCGPTSRAFSPCSTSECNALCADMYSRGSYKLNCESGCAKALELGGCPVASVETQYNADGFALNGGGIGSGRCEDGYETQIFSEADCEKGIESLGYQIATRTNVGHWNAVCGCSFNAETGHMQFNEFTSKDHCYPTAVNKNLGMMQHQDRRSRENRLVAICYSAPPTAHPTAVPTAVPTTEPTSVPTAMPTQVPIAAPTCVPTPDLEWGRLMSGNRCVIADNHGDLSLRECSHGSVNNHKWSLKDGLLRALPAGTTTWKCTLNHNKWPKLRACSGASNQNWTYDCDARLSSVTGSYGTLCMGLLSNKKRLYMMPCDAESVVFRLESTTGRRLEDGNTLLRRLQWQF